PPKATTASGRTKEKKRFDVTRPPEEPGNGRTRPGGPGPGFSREILPDERHRHAARPAPGPRELVRGEAHDGLVRQVELAPPEEEIRLFDDRIAGARELLGRLDVAVVEEDDAGRDREGVRAVGPLLPSLGDRVGSAAAHRREVDLLPLQRGEQVVFRSPGDLALGQVDL